MFFSSFEQKCLQDTLDSVIQWPFLCAFTWSVRPWWAWCPWWWVGALFWWGKRAGKRLMWESCFSFSVGVSSVFWGVMSYELFIKDLFTKVWLRRKLFEETLDLKSLSVLSDFPHKPHQYPKTNSKGCYKIVSWASKKHCYVEGLGVRLCIGAIWDLDSKYSTCAVAEVWTRPWWWAETLAPVGPQTQKCFERGAKETIFASRSAEVFLWVENLGLILA